MPPWRPGCRNSATPSPWTGRNGIFELVGPTGPAVPDATKQYFSARRRQVEERLAEYALASVEAPALAAAVTRGSRADKVEPEADRFAQWRSLAEEHASAARVSRGICVFPPSRPRPTGRR